MEQKRRIGDGSTRTQPTSLTVQAKMWPSPITTDSNTPSPTRQRDGSAQLRDAVSTWPTPSAKLGDSRRGGPSRATAEIRLFEQGRRNLDDAVAIHGRPDPMTAPDGTDGEQRADLNPRFVAALLGVPWDWLNPSTSVETDSFHEWQRKHSPPWRCELASPD